MADIWTSYAELGELCAFSPEEAGALVMLRGWPRRRCSDGTVRVKLPEDLAHQFMVQAVLPAQLSAIVDQNVASLRGVSLQAQSAGDANLARRHA